LPIDTALALMGFAFVMSVSPGPGNFLLLTSGVNFGFGRSLPLILGISLGFLSMVVMVGLGLGQVLKAHPVFGHAIRLACGLYVLWLASKIARSRSLGSGGEQQMGQPFSFVQAAMLQLVNPKAWTVAIIVTASYVDPARPATSLAALVVVFALVNIPSISLWAISGKALRIFLGQGNRIAVFNIAMAVLLVGSMAPVILASVK
jgi:threonine/homoserine/homoserine lactone efflux protein